MAHRNRVIYQSQAVYVSQDINSTGILTGNNDNIDLDRIQSCNYSFSISRQDVNQFGELASIDRIITETPTVSLEGSYLMANMGNEKKLGFNIFAGPNDAAATTPVSCLSGILNTETNDTVKNYYILTTKEGSDAIDNTASGNYDSESIVGIGNASITSYSTEGAVGGLPSTSFSVEGQNLNVVQLPYTGAFLNYTGLNAPTTQPQFAYDPKRIDGYGFETVGDIFVGITGAETFSAGSSNLMTIVGLESGISAADQPNMTQTPKGLPFALPQGYVLKSNDTMAQSSPVTITLDAAAEKGANVIHGTIANGQIVTPVVGPPYFIPVFTGTQAYNPNVPVVAYISGSNPSINATDGTENLWNAHSGNASAAGTLLKQKAGASLNPAPIKLPVPSTSLNTSDVNPSGSISTLRPGDITLTLKKSDGSAEDIAGASFSDAHIQSYTISFDLGRTPMQRIGSRFAFSRPVDFPVTASFSFDAVLSDLTTGSIADLIDCDENYEAVVQLKHAPDCNAANVKETVAAYVLKKIKLESQSFSTSIGDNKTVTMDFSCQIGGPEQSDVGVFMSGYSTEINENPLYS